MSENDACRIIIDDSRVTLQIVASFTDNSKVIICTLNILIVLATGKHTSVTLDLLAFASKGDLTQYD